MVELRADLLNFTTEQYKSLFGLKSKIVFTCRPQGIDPEYRKSLFHLAAENKVDYIDLEIESYEPDMEWLSGLCRKNKTDLILSYHNYIETPGIDELTAILKKFYKLGADVAKIATLVKNDEDLLNLLLLYRKQGRKVVLGMGEKGILTRVAALILGAEFSFAAPGKERGTAPGQLTVSDMNELVKIMQIQRI